MQLKTILNHVQKQPGFVYERVRLVKGLGRAEIEVEVRSRAGSRPKCSGCDQPGAGYDRLGIRRFEFVPLWGLAVFFVYVMRRVDCQRCGVRVEGVPWAEGKSQLTTTYAWFLASWAKRLSWQEVARAFRTSWETVFRSVDLAVRWGLAHRSLDQIQSIGIDEIQWLRGHKYLTLVYQIDTGRRRLLWIGQDRKLKTLLRFFRFFGKERSATLRYICSDMWKPYLRVVAKKANQAIHVLDRFHIMSHLSKAIDEVRATEVRALKANGYQPLLTHTRWLLLKRPENLSPHQEVKLVELLRYNLRSVRAYLLKEQFQIFWFYTSPTRAAAFLDGWCTRTMRSQIEPMKKVARMLRTHRELLLNWFRAKGLVSAGPVEGFNNKAKLTIRRAFGFRTFRALEVALYHSLGDLPAPEVAHRFC
jgi:transposase